MSNEVHVRPAGSLGNLRGTGDAIPRTGSRGTLRDSGAGTASPAPSTASGPPATTMRPHLASGGSTDSRSRSATPLGGLPLASTPTPGAAPSGTGGVTRGTGLFKPMTQIEYKALRFVVHDAPSDTNLAHYVREMQRHGVTDVVRACEPTYSAAALAAHGLGLHELNFKDGDPPPAAIIAHWLQIVAAKFVPGKAGSVAGVAAGGAIAVHCVAGLGRAPVLVAIALIEAGMPALEAVEFIRSRRRGALNMKQIHFLDSYKRKGKGKLAGLPSAPVDPSSADAAPPPAAGAGAGGAGGPAAASGSDKCAVM
ncbi:hypothetical protein H9P43_009981 [Blastocladiella emersonii ATCC 22665]|nr:hypothetical protein H9P43_009981 [Blastocladiella emersonii ATCC 22665]